MKGPTNEVAELAHEIMVAEWVAETDAGPPPDQQPKWLHIAMAAHLLNCGWRRT